jgi:hypothetical protein
LIIKATQQTIKIMKNIYLKTNTVLLAALIITSSCSSSTYIESTPTGADLYLDGESAGQTPYQMTDTKIVFSCTTVRIEKEGYQTHYASICRDEEADVGAIIGGILLWVPFLWTLKYKPHRHYKLRPLNNEKALEREDINYDGFEMLIEEEED